MSNRLTVLQQITSALKNDFTNVSNKFILPDTILQKSTSTSQFPYLIVSLAPGSTDQLTLDGREEDQITIPIVITAYQTAKTEDSLMEDVASLLDDIITSLTKSTNVALFHANCFAITEIFWTPAEDEEYSDVGFLFIDVITIASSY